MKTNYALKYLWIVLATMVFHYLFWKQGYGVNVLIYTAFVLTYSLFFDSRGKPWSVGIILISAMLLCSLAIVWHSSAFTIVMYYITFVLFMGWLQEKELQALFYVASGSIISFYRLPGQFIKNLPLKQDERNKLGRIYKLLKLSIIPLVVLMIFYLIYINANPVFENISGLVLEKIANWLARIFNAISIERLLFILFGLVISGWIIFKTDLRFLSENESSKLSNLIRKRVKQFFPSQDYIQNLKENTPVFYRKKFALSLRLKNEYISAVVLLSLVNALLLIVNIIDINWVWFGFKYSESFNLKQFVHEGTYLLIISILLSMGIMLYFFRKNLNFYRKSKLIKIMAYVWIFQNLILAISVAIRNLHYITYWGLAYKRIGVIVFLIAVVYGLVSLFIKIRHTKTAFYLLKKNTMAVYLILIIASLFNWDAIIAKHNLNHSLRNHMETSYLLSLSDKVLPMIHQKKDVLQQDKSLNTYADYSPYSYEEYYKLRVELFLAKYEAEGWQSWNYEEWRAYNYLKNK